jgi:AAA-like domain
LQRLSQFIDTVLLTQIPENIVIFIDEIDNLINRYTKDEFLEFIRACYNQRAEKPAYQRLTFCLLGVVTPSDLKDKTGTPFNIGKAIELTGFKFAEARLSLTKGFMDKIHQPEKVLKQVLYWTGGQPFLTQKLCRLIAANSENTRPNIKYLVQNYIIDNWELQDSPEHLRTIKNPLINNNISADILLNLYKKIWQKNHIYSKENPEKLALRLSGLVVKKTE